jgi:NAD(P)-dependent dehydrogenase (short-subunit alcohol dehydrogenase family)
MFGGVSLQQFNSELQRKKRSESMRTIKKAEDKKLLEKTELRAERLKRLVKIEDQDGLECSLLLDGCAEDGSSINSTVLLCDVEKEASVNATLEDQKRCNGSGSGSRDGDGDSSTVMKCSDVVAPEEHLNQFRSCYICKRRYSKLHHFYHSLCEICAAHNWGKRMQVCDMSGRICLVTGGRVKIGFQCCLKLLRCGATVICTSRFPADAAKRFAIQKDFHVWKSRLFTVGLDLRDLAYLEFFCQHLYKTFSKLDVIINNACQTIRRPRGYYTHLVEDEQHINTMAKQGDWQNITLTIGNEEEENSGSDSSAPCGANTGEQTFSRDESSSTEGSAKKRKFVMEGSDACSLLSLDSTMRDIYTTECLESPNRLQSASSSSSSEVQHVHDKLPISHLTSAEMSQVPMSKEDHNIEPSSHLLPANLRDVNNQQIDLRRKNSWLLKTDEVETPEVAEVFAINSISPFVLISKLKKLLISGKKSFAEDLSSDSSVEFKRKRESIQNKSRLKTLNDFILESIKGEEGGNGVEEDAWTKSAANHRGTNLEAVSASNCSFIVNVSSMEGKFYRPKTVFHSHTNMAKAALNMLTRTASMDYQSSNVYMSAVDTGWINDENPLEKASRIAKTSNFCTPLDEVDAAARILDPIFTPIHASQVTGVDSEGLCSPPFGCFLKDYHISEW